MQIQENRKRLTPIINTIIFCGRYGIPLRGHRDYGPLNVQNSFVEVTPGEGKFRGLLKFRVNSGDDVLRNHLMTCPKNASYISPTIQNEVITACNSLILRKVILNVKEAKYFSVLADETTDVAKLEQFSLCVRYIKDNIVHESFLQFVPVTSTTGESLANVIIQELKKYGLDLNNLRGQGYDGAASMSGKFNGVQAIIRQLYPTALYVHCASHSLNLAISDASTVQPIRNCMGLIENAFNFFNTPKRQTVLTGKVDELNATSKRDRLKQLCPTRWIQRQDSIIIMKELLESVISALEDIATWKDRESSSGATLLKNSLSSSEFILSLLVIEVVFSFTLPLSKLLQMINIDLFQAVSLAENCLAELENLRNNADTAFNNIYLEGNQLILNIFGEQLKRPRLTLRQRNRANFGTETTEEYYKLSIFIPFLDNVTMQLKERFIAHKNILVSFGCLVPSPEKIENLEDQLLKFELLVDFYRYDLDDVSKSVASGEFKLWYRRFYNSLPEEFPNSPLNALSVCDSFIFPHIYTLLKILCTLPVSTATSERTFSTLKLLKTYLRNTISEDRLNGLTLLYIYPSVIITPDEVLDELQKKSRKLDIVL